MSKRIITNELLTSSTWEGEIIVKHCFNYDEELPQRVRIGVVFDSPQENRATFKIYECSR